METTTTEKPYQKYPDDATPLVFFLGAVFAVCLIYYIFKLYKCLQGKARGDSPSTNTSSSGIKPKCSTNYFAYLLCVSESYEAPQIEYPNSLHLPEEILRGRSRANSSISYPRVAITTIEENTLPPSYANSIHLTPVSMRVDLADRARSRSVANMSNFTFTTEVDLNPPSYANSLLLSPTSLRVDLSERARSRSVTNFPAPDYRNFRSQFPTSPINFPRKSNADASVASPPTYDEAVMRALV